MHEWVCAGGCVRVGVCGWVCAGGWVPSVPLFHRVLSQTPHQSRTGPATL